MKKNILTTIIFVYLVNFTSTCAAIDRAELDKAEKDGSTYAICSGVSAAYASLYIARNDMEGYAIADRRSMGYRDYALKTLSKSKVDSTAKTFRDLVTKMAEKNMTAQFIEMGDYCRYKGFLSKIE